MSFTKERDGAFELEDHMVVVLDPFQDGRSGYVFALNPGGARFDALVDPGGESINKNWDGNWEAAASRDDGAGRRRSGYPSRPSASSEASANGV